MSGVELVVVFGLVLLLILWVATRIEQRPPTLVEQVASLTASFDEIRRVIGNEFVPALVGLATVVEGFMEAVEESE